MLIEEYIKSLIDEWISLAVPEEQPVVLIDLSEPSVPSPNPIVSELQRKRDELKSRLEECDSCFPEKADRLRILLKENRELSGHVSVIDAAFSDLVQKYEKARTTVMCYRQSEEIKTEHTRKMIESIEKIEEKYHGLKAHATAELQKANTERSRLYNKCEAELKKYTTLVKGMRIKYNNILQDGERKTKELEALTTVFDEISTKVQK